MSRRFSTVALVVSLVVSAITSVRAPALAASCTPQAGFSNCQVFTYTGALQTFTVPANVTLVYVEMWGAGGGGGNHGYYINQNGGGGGGYTAGTIAVTGGQAFGIEVGGGGVINSLATTYGGGGAGGNGSGTNRIGSSGGGGGWYGGGGGQAQNQPQQPYNGPGGGGSSYYGGAGVTGGTTTASLTVTTPATSPSAGVAANNTDSEYIAGVGNGGLYVNGGNGEIVIQYNIVPVPLTKSFSPSSVTGASASTLTISVANPNAYPYTVSSAFTDTMPTSVTITSSSNAGTCTGVTVTSSGVSMASGTSVPAGGCTIVVSVSAATSGTFANTTSSLVTSAGTAPAATANLTSTPPVLTTTKAFLPSTIFAGATSTLTVTIANTATGAYALSGLAMTSDPLPSGLVVASTPAATTTCGGSVSATAGATNFSLSGGTLGSGSTCSVSVNVTATAAGSYLNDIPAANFTTTQGSTSAADATATLQVTSILIGPVSVPSATGSYDGVVATTNNNDFVERAFAPTGFNAINTSTVVGSPSGNAYTSAVPGIAVRHQLHNYGSTATNVVFIATAPIAPSGWTVGVYNDSSGSLGTQIAGTASSNTYTTTTPLAVAAGADVYVWTVYAAPTGVASFTRFDSTLTATDNAYAFNTNNVHDELYSGYIVQTKSYTIVTTNCTPSSQPAGVWCPGATLTYTIDVRNIALPANGTTPSSATLQAVNLIVTDNGTNPNSWAHAGGYMNTPGLTTTGTAPTSFLYYYNATSSSTFPANYNTTNLVQSFTATWSALTAGQNGQLTFSAIQF
jgi:hypothetical protein